MSDLFRREINQLNQFIRQDKPDIINAHWSYEFALAAIKSRVPHLITIRDNAWKILQLKRDLYRLIRLYMNQKVFILGKHFNVNSNYLKKQLKTLGNGIEVIPNPIQERFIKDKWKTLNKKINLVSILNNWGEIKNPIPALKAFKLLRKEYGENVSYSIYGPNYGINEIAHRWALKNDCAKQVVFKGAVSHNQLMKELSNYDMLLHPAKEESFGNMLLEGMANGLPVIGGRNSGAVPEVLDFGKNGILTNINSPGEIFKSINLLMSDPTLFTSLSKSGITYVKEHYSSSIIATKYLALYEKILNE